MKKIIIPILLLGSISIYSQSDIMRILDSDPRLSATLRSNNVYDPNKNNNTITGNPYSSTEFETGTIPNINANIIFKYNAYKDVIEFKDGNNIYELPKDVTYSPIKLNDNTNIVLETNNDGSSSYYTELYQNNSSSLLKKYKVNLLDAKPTDGYREATAPKFSSLKTEYYLKTNNSIIEFPKNKKELLSKYSNNLALEQFVKKNGSYIKDENAMKEIVKIISQK
ncbi:hypothetical protein [Epilithonimonas xixisoli]|uniref:Uncharacterized protein n=1 Tax=Epilithonimonas xixisoli TaxID=1476462 RepID=A0A4R8IG66_9FLAO|nr:hypothetical protein [Epilithonimonas xixisoli]TDX84760.1 hypothetical protein B0I22_2392 [Epilithonimonas xixisoli]